MIDRCFATSDTALETAQRFGKVLADGGLPSVEELEGFQRAMTAVAHRYGHVARRHRSDACGIRWPAAVVQ
jgi:hypothetical protein